MKLAITSLAAAMLAVVVSASPATSADTKTWYVYCEGNRQDDHWAVFSENFWPHPLTEGYGRRVSSAAKTFFEQRHDVKLEGCAAVSFVDFSLAEHSRSRTAQLHKSMGDRVYFFPLPSEALPAEVAAAPEPVAIRASASRPVEEPAGVAPAAKSPEPQRAFRPTKSDR